MVLCVAILQRESLHFANTLHNLASPEHFSRFLLVLIWIVAVLPLFRPDLHEEAHDAMLWLPVVTIG